VRNRLQPRQAEKTAGPLDRVNKAEDAAENRLVAGIALELDEFGIDDGRFSLVSVRNSERRSSMLVSPRSCRQVRVRGTRSELGRKSFRSA
jgi:hypothetical protein